MTLTDTELERLEKLCSTKPKGDLLTKIGTQMHINEELAKACPALITEVKRLRDVLTEIHACLDAATWEGFEQEVYATGNEKLCDIWHRRLSRLQDQAKEAIQQPTE